MKLADYKKLFLHGKHIHLNNAGLSPISLPVRQEIDYWSNRFHEDGFHSDKDYKLRMEWSRGQVAKLIDCDAGEVAFFQSCAWGITQFAFGINLKKGDEVLIFEQEYSSNLYPWQAACKKAEANLKILNSESDLQVPLEIIVRNITSRTKVITVSSVQYQTGAVFDLEALSLLCQQKNILLFVDATQSVGIHAISFKKLSLAGLACSSHKWLNAPVGVGFLAVEKELITSMQPIGIGAQTYGDCDDPSALECAPKLNALKFEAGALQVLEINALGKSVELINQVGTETLKKEAFRFADLIRTEIEKLGLKMFSPFKKANESQFINFTALKDNKALQKYFHSADIHLPIRGPGIRVSPHGINTDDEIQKFIEILKKM